jgi:MFS family permease
MFGTFILLPFMFQILMSDSPAVTGLKIAPLALMFLIVAPLGGRLTNILGARTTPHIGLAVAAAGFYILSRVVATDVDMLVISGAIAILGVGLGLTNAPLTTAALHDVPPDKQGVAASLPTMSRFIGGSFGMALVGTFLSWRLTSYLIELGVDAGGQEGALSGDISAATAEPVYQQAFTDAFQDVFLFSILIVAAAFIAVFFVPQLKDDHAG